MCVCGGGRQWNGGHNNCRLCLCSSSGGPRGARRRRGHNLQCPARSHLSPAAEVQENRSRNNKSKMLDNIRSLSTKVRNQHEECQCLHGGGGGEETGHLKICIYSEPALDQTVKLIRSSFNPRSAPSSLYTPPPLTEYRLSTPAIAMTTPGWPAVTSPRGRSLTITRYGSFDRLGQRCACERTRGPFLNRARANMSLGPPLHRPQYNQDDREPN